MSAERSAALSELSLVWECRSTKRNRYEGRVKDGGVLLSVHCDTSDQVSRAEELLKRTGAEDISSAGEKAVSSHGVYTDNPRPDRPATRL